MSQRHSHYPDLTARRRLAMTSAVRSTTSIVLMLVVYYGAPLNRQLDIGVAIWFITGLVGLGVVLTWQIRSVSRSSAPLLRAIETVAFGLPLLLLIFASTYVLISSNVPGSFTEQLDHTAALYFTMTVFTTVGFGDITPTTDTARVITMTQMVVGLLAVGVVARILVNAVRDALGQRDDDRASR